MNKYICFENFKWVVLFAFNMSTCLLCDKKKITVIKYMA